MNQWLFGAALLMSTFSDGQAQIAIPRQGGGQSPYLSFCQQRFYEEKGGRLLCNWAVNFNYACFISYPNDKVIQAGAKISEPEVVGKCDNGEPIIKLYHY